METVSNSIKVLPNGRIIDTEDIFNVDSVKWEVNGDKYFAGISTHVLTIYHDKDTRLRLLEIEKGYSHEHLTSIWIDVAMFHKLPYYDWEKGKYKAKLIRDKIVELLKSADLSSLQKESVGSCALKYLWLNK